MFQGQVLPGALSWGQHLVLNDELHLTDLLLWALELTQLLPHQICESNPWVSSSSLCALLVLFGGQALR